MKTFVYYLLFFSSFLSAQINESDTLKVKAKLALTGFYQGGNVETLIFRAKSDLSIKPWERWVFKNQNSFVYQEFGREKADADILSLNFLYFNPDRKVYPVVLAIVSTNFRREINFRSLLGAGVNFQILSTENSLLKFAISSEYEQTKFDETNFNRSEYDGNRSINTFRSTLWVNGKHNMFKKKLIVNHEFYFQPSLEHSNNFRWQADIGLELPLWKFLNFKINYVHTFESIVIQNQKQEDNILTFGFTLKSY